MRAMATPETARPPPRSAPGPEAPACAVSSLPSAAGPPASGSRTHRGGEPTPRSAAHRSALRASGLARCARIDALSVEPALEIVLGVANGARADADPRWPD